MGTKDAKFDEIPAGAPTTKKRGFVISFSFFGIILGCSFSTAIMTIKSNFAGMWVIGVLASPSLLASMLVSSKLTKAWLIGNHYRTENVTEELILVPLILCTVNAILYGVLGSAIWNARYRNPTSLTRTIFCFAAIHLLAAMILFFKFMMN